MIDLISIAIFAALSCGFYWVHSRLKRHGLSGLAGTVGEGSLILALGFGLVAAVETARFIL